jgi:hypothetical protein
VVNSPRYERRDVSGCALGPGSRSARVGAGDRRRRLEVRCMVYPQIDAGGSQTSEPKQWPVHDFRPDRGATAVAHHDGQED